MTLDMISMNDISLVDIPGFVGYKVDVSGNFYSTWRRNGRHSYAPDGVPKLMKGTTTKKGYKRVTIRVDNEEKSVLVHVVVALCFIGPKPDGMQVRHLDGNASNNCASNLAYGTAQENAEDKRKHGTHLFGETNSTAKLTNEQVIQIRNRRNAGEKASALALEFGVTSQTIYKIAQKKVWKHLQ